MANNLRFIGQEVPSISRLKKSSIDVGFVQATVIEPLQSKIKPVQNMFNFLKNENDEKALRCLTECESQINTILSARLGNIHQIDEATNHLEDSFSPKQ